MASHAIATIPTDEGERFNLMQREARLFASSPLIPEHLRKGGPEQAMANCYIALKMARTMGEDALVVLQNIHVVNGKAGFASQYMIARANAAGIFKGRINWRVDKSNPQNLAVTAFATLGDTGEVVEFTVDMAMATAEGWTKNPKYRTMPEVMLRYRSAAFLVRFYAPDVMLGYHTAEEVEDVIIAASPPATTLTSAMLLEQAAPVEDAEVVEAVPVETHGKQTAEQWASEHRAQADNAETLEALAEVMAKGAKPMVKLQADKPELWAEVNAAYAARRHHLEREGKPDADMGEGFTDDEEFGE